MPAEIGQPFPGITGRTDTRVDIRYGGKLCKQPGRQVDIIQGGIDLTQRLNNPCPVHQRLAGLGQLFVHHPLGGDLTVAGGSRDRQQQQRVGIPSGVVHPQKAHHFPLHRNGRRHETFDSLGLQYFVGLCAGVIVRRHRRDEKLPLLLKCLKPAFQSFDGNVLKIVNLCCDTRAAPLEGIVEYPVVFAHFKDIGTVRVIILADVLKNTVQRLPVLRLIQIIPEKLLDRLRLAVQSLFMIVHTAPSESQNY